MRRLCPKLWGQKNWLSHHNTFLDVAHELEQCYHSQPTDLFEVKKDELKL
jgi:hypothetical protein